MLDGSDLPAGVARSTNTRRMEMGRPRRTCRLDDRAMFVPDLGKSVDDRGLLCEIPELSSFLT